MTAPALSYRTHIYQTSNWKFGDVLAVASQSMTEVGLTNVQQQTNDVFVVTASMMIAIGVVEIGNIFVVIVMVAGNNANEVVAMRDKLAQQLSKHNPL